MNSSFISDVSSNTSIDCADLLSECEKKNEEPAANNDVNQSQLADEIEKILNDIRTLETKKAIKI